MDRRQFVLVSLAGGCSLVALGGCRGYQYGKILKGQQPDMVGSHAAGAETFNPLIDESVAKLLARQEEQVFQPVSHNELPPPQSLKSICFVCVENKSAEELGDFREQIYEQIDSQILESKMFRPISRRYVEAALRETRMRPDALVLPENARTFAAVLEQQGQPFEYMLYATITSGTTRDNAEYQRDYVLTLELVNIATGEYDKESAKIRKGYYKSKLGLKR